MGSIRASEKPDSRGVARTGWWIGAGLAVCLAGCRVGGGDPAPVLAKVNGEVIGADQVDFMVQQNQRTARPEQRQDMRRQILEHLIDSELASQSAEKQRLDHEPRIALALQEARREVLAQAWFETMLDKIAKPSAADVKQYYDAHAARFAARKNFDLQKVDAELSPDHAAELAAALQRETSAEGVTAALAAQGVHYRTTRTRQPSEALGAALQKIDALRDGASLALARPYGLTILTVLSRQPAPLTLEQARAEIESQLHEERRRSAAAAAIARLREGAKIEYPQGSAGSAGAASGGRNAPAAASSASGPRGP